MSEQKDVVEKGVQDLEKEITCAICHERYAEPKVLPCCHYYCKQCLRLLTIRTGVDKPFPCPECRKDTTLPKGGLDNLPSAFFVNRMKEVHSKLELACGKVEAKCEMCLEDKAEAFCRHCVKFICAECAKSHEKMKTVFSGHIVSTLAELREGGAKGVVTVQKQCHESCDLHEQPRNLYCYDCEFSICRDCIVKDHLGHNYEFIKVAAPEIKQKLLKQLDPLQESQKSLLSAVQCIQTTKSDVQDQGRSVAEQIVTSLGELQVVIEDCKQALLAEVTVQVQRKSESLSEQEKGLATANTSIQAVIDYTEQCVEHSADAEIMHSYAEIQSRIDREIVEQQKEHNLEPAEEVDIGIEISCTEYMKELCRAKMKISTLQIDATKCVVTERAETTKVGETSQFFVQVVAELPNGKPTKQAYVVECSFKCLWNNSITSSQVKPVGENKYCIQYTPALRGRHELTVTLNKQELPGSPFPVFVSIHPAQLGKPVRIITGVDDPYEVTASAAGNIAVISGKKVVLFDREGKKLPALDLSKFNITNPQGVIMDDAENCIYITEKYCEIFKIRLTPDLQLMARLTAEKSNNFGRLTLVGDEIVVCERKSNTVLVFSKLLEYKRKIGSSVGNIKDVSADDSKNLYITDYRGCIRAFKYCGEFLRSLAKLKVVGPVGVCVAGLHVYVANYRGNSVSVFTTEGEYVTTFGHSVSKEGEFFSPRGLCVDRDGFVHVCDDHNSKIQIF